MTDTILEIVLDENSLPRPPTPPPHRTLARLFTLHQLRSLCIRHGLPVSGTKHELAERLVACGATGELLKEESR